MLKLLAVLPEKTLIGSVPTCLIRHVIRSLWRVCWAREALRLAGTVTGRLWKPEAPWSIQQQLLLNRWLRGSDFASTVQVIANFGFCFNKKVTNKGFILDYSSDNFKSTLCFVTFFTSSANLGQSTRTLIMLDGLRRVTTTPWVIILQDLDQQKVVPPTVWCTITVRQHQQWLFNSESTMQHSTRWPPCGEPTEGNVCTR